MLAKCLCSQNFKTNKAAGNNKQNYEELNFFCGIRLKIDFFLNLHVFVFTYDN